MISSKYITFARLRFYIGNVYRFVSGVKYQKRININQACTIFGSSFCDNGWHHIRETLKEYDGNPSIDYRDTTMYHFMKYFCPKSICDLSNNKKKCNLSLFEYPWGKIYTTKSKDPLISRFCGPSSDEFIQDEYNRTINLYNELKKTSYKPWKFGNQFIEGMLLINRFGEKRFVVLQGNHRMAIFSHLGMKTINIRLSKLYRSPIKESDVLSWVNVKRGLISVESAKNIFNLFFKENGFHIKAFKI